MVWKNSKNLIKLKINKKNTKKTNFLHILKTKKYRFNKIEKKEPIFINNKKRRLNLFKITNPLLLKTGIIHSIDRLTGKKIKNSFSVRQELKLRRGLMRFNQKNYSLKKKNVRLLTPNLKKIIKNRLKKTKYENIKKSVKIRQKKWKRFKLFFFKSKGLIGFEKKINIFKKKIRLRESYNFLKKKMLKSIKDGSSIMSNKNTNMLTKYLKNNYKSKKNYIPKNIMSKYNQIYSGALVNVSQKIYVQSKLKNTENYLKYGYNDKLIELKVPSEMLRQKSEHYNNFLKQCFYKNLLFRSFWFSKFISTLVVQGKKQMVWKNILSAFIGIKAEFGKNPVILLFDILELYRMPIKALPPKDKTRKIIIRTHLISWWKQYTQILRWMRQSLSGSVKNHQSWNSRVSVELKNLLNENSNTIIKKRCEINYELAAFGRVNLHFRWYRRFSKRAVNAIKIIDRPLYGR